MKRMEDRLRSLRNNDEAIDLDEWKKIYREGVNAIPQLQAVLSHSDTFIVQTAAGLLGAQGGNASGAIPALADLMRHLDPNVRAAAAAALGLICCRPRVSIPALARALTDPHVDVRRRAATAIGRFSKRDIIKNGALQALDEAATDHDRYVREFALDTLGTRRPMSFDIKPTVVHPRATPISGGAWMRSAAF